MNHSSTLTLLQRLWLGVAGGILIITIFVLVAAGDDETVPAALSLLLVAAAGIGAVVGARTLDRFFAASPPADDATALAEFRQRAYLAVGIAEAPVLFGVAVAFVLGPRWAAAVGGTAGLAVLAVAAPTTARIHRIEAAWHRAGRDVSILRAAADDTRPTSGGSGTERLTD